PTWPNLIQTIVNSFPTVPNLTGSIIWGRKTSTFDRTVPAQVYRVPQSDKGIDKGHLYANERQHEHLLTIGAGKVKFSLKTWVKMVLKWRHLEESPFVSKNA